MSDVNGLTRAQAGDARKEERLAAKAKANDAKAGLSGDAMTMAVERLIADKIIREVQTTSGVGRGRKNKRTSRGLQRLPVEAIGTIGTIGTDTPLSG